MIPDDADKTDERGEATGLTKIVSSLPVDHSGTTVYLKGWRLPASDKPPIVIVHDLGEHAELYRDTAERFALAGYTTYVFDLRGHGRSGRRLGHAPSFGVLVKDLLQVAAWVRHKEGGKAPVILGQGIGALITMEFTKHHGSFCRAAILSAPCLEPLAETGITRSLALKVLAETVPTFSLPGRLFPRFARQLAAFARGTESPKLTAILAHELLAAIKRAEARFIEYHGSVLILCPERDEVTTFAQLKKSAALHNEHNLRIVDLPDTSHHVFTEDQAARERALATILPWLEADLAGRPGDVMTLDTKRGEKRGDARAEPRTEPVKGATKD